MQHYSFSSEESVACPFSVGITFISIVLISALILSLGQNKYPWKFMYEPSGPTVPRHGTKKKLAHSHASRIVPKKNAPKLEKN